MSVQDFEKLKNGKKEKEQRQSERA